MAKKCLKCGNNVFGGGYCIRHQYLRTDKKPKQVKAVFDKESANENKSYYAKAIFLNIKKNNGRCKCDECGEDINKPTGRNVCHIIGKGANTALYHDVRNHLVLGKGELFGECNCGWMFDESGSWEEMNVALYARQTKETLNLEYYNRKSPD